MSKLSFRARQLDAYKSMPVYRSEEIPEVTDVAAINRAVPQMPTGMEKEEETEHHLQRALSAQQVYGTAEALVIPVPDIDDVRKQYEQVYSVDYKLPRQYIHAQTYADQEIPDYDMDSEDEAWLTEQSKKMEITAVKFEEMLDRLEKCSGQQVVTLQEAKLLLKDDDDLIITVYDYWLNKRLKYTPHSLIPTVKTEKRDGSTTNNPYVAFRRRTEKMQTRKNRKNDEVSYEKMLKLRRDLQRAVTMLEMVKKREKFKKELLQLSIEIVEKQYDMEDFSGANLAHAEAQKSSRPVFYPLYEQYNKDGGETVSRKKRKYEKRKHKSASTSQFHSGSGDVDVIDYGSTEDDAHSTGASLSDQEDESHPDGIYAFRRKKYCNYHAPLETCGNWPWHSRSNGGLGDKKYRYALTSVDLGPETVRCIGYARCRRGRGGRVIFDRAYPEQRADFWDRVLDSSVPTLTTSKSMSSDTSTTTDSKLLNPSQTSVADTNTSNSSTFRKYIENNKWLHFAPHADYDSTNALFNGDGELLNVSSNDASESLIDPIIDIVPAAEPPAHILPQSFTPIVTAPSALPPEELLHPKPAPVSLTIPTSVTPVIKTEPVEVVTSSDSLESASLHYDEHQTQLKSLKKEILNQSTKRSNVNSRSSSLVNSSATTSDLTTNSCGHGAVIDSKEAAFALSALVNGGSAGRGNGIHHIINGPNSKDLISIPGESGDTLTAHSILASDKEYTDSAGLNSIPEVGSTMEVT